MSAAAPLVRVLRSGLEESVHTGHVAVCDPEGRLLAAVGDPHHAVFARSSMKPLQAAVALRRIDVPLADDLVAIVCASHNAEPVHVRAVRRVLRAGGLTEAALRCPLALPVRTEDARRVGRSRRVFHDCSGKHAGMILAAASAGWVRERYLEPDHQLQREILRAVRSATGVERPAIGVDGCGVPVHGVPLSAMATLYARLARPERLGVLGPTARRATLAMHSHPHLVAGTGRTDTLLMSAAPGIVSKGGAEALHCAAILEAGVGVAVKVADGGERASGPALVHALALLGAVPPDRSEDLARLVRRPVLGGGRPVGELVAGFRLRRPRA
ncbi:MAG TPA: asparaginase [Actinomycetota bacterium]|nr:asparaginase [Actinomycetota bacterium]